MPPKIKMMKVTKYRPDTKPVQFRNRRNNESLRAITLQRDDYTCCMCLQPYPEYKLECDHIVPLQQGGEDSDLNTQCLCISCHQLKTTSEQQSRRKN